MRILHIAVVVAVCLASAGCASMGGSAARAAAGASAPAAAVSFLQADRDDNARITPSEFHLWPGGPAREHDAFHAADRNADGVLTLDEWR